MRALLKSVDDGAAFRTSEAPFGPPGATPDPRPYTPHPASSTLNPSPARPSPVTLPAPEAQVALAGAAGPASASGALVRSRTRLVAAVGHRIVWSLHQHSVVAPSALVATVLLTHEARGISLSDLADQV